MMNSKVMCFVVLLSIIGGGVCSAQFANFDSCTGRPTFIVGGGGGKGGGVHGGGARSFHAVGSGGSMFRASSVGRSSIQRRIVKVKPARIQESKNSSVDRFVSPRWL
jgi:hypothetical protein